MTARALTSDELALLRSDTQWSKLYLAILKPNTIYTAVLASVPSSNDRVYQIAFTSGSGTLSNVKPNMTLYVGTSAGAFDLGMVRIRKAPIAGTFYIGLISHIKWNTAGTIYLTVVDDFDLDAKHATSLAGVLSMDVDVAYSNQHLAFSPVPIMGSHAVLWLDSSTVSVDFNAADSWVLDSSISTYTWTAPGSSASTGMSGATPHITYNATGIYRVYLTVTAANGKSTLGVRYVFVYDRADHQPATVFQLAQCVGDYDTGGWMFDMSMEAEATLSEIRDRTLVVFFAEDWYGWPSATKQSIGPLAGRENIVCVGRIVGESIRADREGGLVHFTVQGMQHWLGKIKAFPIEMGWAGVAANWSEMAGMTVDKVLHHILYWHSTVIETMDFYPSNNALYTPDGKTIASNIWGQVADIAMTRLMAGAGVNRFGQLVAEVDPQMVAEADRDWATVMTITTDDYVEGLELGRMTVPECSHISLSTQVTNSAGSTLTDYSYTPGHMPLRYGEPEVADHLLAESQADSNQKAGLMLGWRNNPYPDIPISFAMNNRMFDLWPRQFAQLSISADDSPRGIAFTKKLIPRRMALYFDGDISFMRTEMNFEAESAEQLSVNGDIPENEDVDISVPSLPSFPDLPDLGDFPLPGEPTTTDEGPPEVLVHDSVAGGLFFSKNFNTASPTWLQVNAGLTSTQYLSIRDVWITPSGAVYVTNGGSGVAGADIFIARAPFVGGTFVILDDASMHSPEPPTGFVIDFYGYNPFYPDDVFWHSGNAFSGTPHFYHGSINVYTNIPAFASAFAAAGVNNRQYYGNGQWLVLGNTAIAHFAANYTGLGSVARPMGAAMDSAKYIRVGTLDKFIGISGADNTSLLIGTVGMTVETDTFADIGIGLDAPRFHFKLACDPTGNLIMTSYPSRAGTGGKSADGGSSFTAIPSLPVNNWQFAYAGGSGSDSRWIAAGAYLYYNGKFGVGIWSDKRGDLPAQSPTFDIDALLVVKF